MQTDYRKLSRYFITNYRVIIVLLFIVVLLISIRMMYSKRSGIVDEGYADLSQVQFDQKKVVTLDGNWEFYWGQLLTPEGFGAKNSPQSNTYIKVQGSWYGKGSGGEDNPHKGVATYRVQLKIPESLTDPAIHIHNIVDSYKLYANGQLLAEVGKISENEATYVRDEKPMLIELPKDSTEIDLVIQVASLKFGGGGIRQSPLVGSKRVLEEKATLTLAFQLLFAGGIIMFSIYYLLLFLLRIQNLPALFFSLFCFITAIRSLIWGEEPILIFLPNILYDTRVIINYATGFNMITFMTVFILSLYPLDYHKRIAAIVIFPILLMDGLLIFPEFVSLLTRFTYIMLLLQLFYIVIVLIKAVLKNREHSMIILGATCIFLLTVIADIFFFLGIGSINLSYMFLFGNYAVIIAMSYVQAHQQASVNKKLFLYNEKLIETDKLKDKIIATEMSFLQAQIKPHFLYNALNAIANVSEKDGKKASKLIVDLAVYLRSSLEFNALDKMVTIEKEIEFVDTYFNIERARFGDKISLTYQIEVPYESQVPVLILQPLVENAVRHGISKKFGGGSIHVKMTRTDLGVEIEVEDNGVGIDQAVFSALLDRDGDSQGVGLYNIHNRLMMFYGAGLSISSLAGKGTKVIFTIPQERKTK